MPQALRLCARSVLVAFRARYAVEGRERLPLGAAIIAARHYHHALDGAVLTAALHRRVHIVVGLDWVHGAPLRAAMEVLCRAAQWPVVLRPQGMQSSGSACAYDASERVRYLRHARTQAIDLLVRHELVAVFPEGFPNIDPSATPKRGHDFLPFDRGFVSLALAAGRHLGTPVPIVPAGLAYRSGPTGWDVALRLGDPVFCLTRRDAARTAARVEAAVWVSSS